MSVLRDKAKRNQIRHELFAKLEEGQSSVADTLRLLRKILAMDQMQFCAKVGIGLSTLRKIEQNSGNVTIETLRKVFEPFGLELVVRTRKKAVG